MNKLKFNLIIYIFDSKIDSSTSNFIKIKIFFWNVPLGKIYNPMGPFFYLTFVHMKIFRINLSLFCYFSMHFSFKLYVKSWETIVYLKRAHFFSILIFIFLFLLFVVLKIFDFKFFDFIQKNDKNTTLISNISKNYTR